ncbi:hypothetical protein [Legionella fairfieldensis]
MGQKIQRIRNCIQCFLKDL